MAEKEDDIALQFADLSSQVGHFERHCLNFWMSGEDFHVLQCLRRARAIFSTIERRSLRQFRYEFGLSRIGENDFEVI
jgi:hypothetical protein